MENIVRLPYNLCAYCTAVNYDNLLYNKRMKITIMILRNGVDGIRTSQHKSHVIACLEFDHRLDFISSIMIWNAIMTRAFRFYICWLYSTIYDVLHMYLCFFLFLAEKPRVQTFPTTLQTWTKVWLHEFLELFK